MRLLIVFAVTALLLAGAEAKTKKVAPRKTTAAAPRAILVLPDRAVKNEDGSYRFTDAQGKKWTYWRTPFGVSRKEDRPADIAARAEDMARRSADMRATDAGDTIRFERPGPFGTY